MTIVFLCALLVLAQLAPHFYSRRPPAGAAPLLYMAYPGTSHTTIMETEDGLKLFGQWWEPQVKQPRAVILLLHGTAMHSGIYAPWASHLADRAYAIFGYDMRGWGQSQGFGRAGFSPNNDAYVKDIPLALSEIRSRYPDTPIFIQGESLGAGVALQWGMRGPDQTEGLILNVPPVVVNLKVGPFRQPDWLANALLRAGGLIGRLLPNAPVYSMTGFLERLMWENAIFDTKARAGISKDRNITHSTIAASYLATLSGISSEIRKNLDKVKVPLIVLQGGNDYLHSPRAAQAIVNQTASRGIRDWRFYKTDSHCALHDSNKAVVWQDIIDWLDKMTGPERDLRISADTDLQPSVLPKKAAPTPNLPPHVGGRVAVLEGCLPFSSPARCAGQK